MAARSLTARQRVEFRLARLLGLLPARAQVRISGKPPIRIDDQTLEPEIQMMLALVERQGNPPMKRLSPPAARAEMRSRTAVAGGPPLPGGGVRALTVDGATGPLRARHYTPAEPGG